MRVVLDTNIWISGILKPQGNAGRLLEAWRLQRFDIVLSPYILREIEQVLSYPKIQKRIQWNKEKIKTYVNFIAFFAEIITPKDIRIEVESDPNDTPILAVFLESGANYLITGDDDLLSMREQYAIISITEFLLFIEDSLARA